MKISRVACAAIVLAWLAMTAPAGAVVDLDGDGVGDVWRLKYDAAGLAGSADADGDGKSNADEARAGTDPKSAMDTLRVRSVVRNGGNIEIRWGTVAGKRYKVQSAAEPGTAATWTDATGFLEGSGGEMMQALPLPGSRTFFRVAVYEKDSDSDGVDDWEELQLGLDPNEEHPHGPGDLAYVTAGLTATNVVTVLGPSAAVAESATVPGLVTVARAGGFGAVTVSYAVSGSAAAGADYVALSGSVVVPFGAKSATIAVTPLADALLESPEAVVVTLIAGAGYTVGQPAAAGLLIADQAQPAGTGLRAQFWNEGPLSDTVPAVFPATGPNLTRVDATVDFFWPSGQSPSTPATTITDNHFSSRWSGEVLPEFSQNYTFSYEVNRAGRLWVNGKLLVNNWPPATLVSTTFTAIIPLEGGRRYPIVVEQYDNSGDARAHLRWQSASQALQVIPQARLFATVPPQISSALEALAFVGGPAVYQITASANPTSFGAVNLPPGLTVNTSSGQIAGTPTQPGTWQVVLTATNATGSGSAILKFEVLQAGGGITREVWTGIAGSSVASIPLDTAPASTSLLTSLQGPVDEAENFGARMRGYVTAPATGAFRFFLRADEAAELYVSDDDDPVNAFRRAVLTAPSSGGDWTGAAQSDLLYLKAGARYYLEVRHKEGTGSDHVAVGWSRPGQADTAPGEVVPGYVLTRYEDVPLGIAEGTLYYASLLPQSGTVTNGYGTCTIRLNQEQTVAYVTATYSGLGSAFAGMHVHDDRLPNGANIIFDPDEAGVERTPDGAYVWPIVGVGALSAAQIVQGLGTNSYFNIHSVTYPNGEIKGYPRRLDGSQTFTVPPTPPDWTAEAGTAHTNAAAAARFLTQATYGCNGADLAALQAAASYEAWIDAQIALPPSDTYTDVFRKQNDSFDPSSGNLMFNSWWRTAITAPDQLRQRVAFALSEIMVTSENGPLNDQPFGLSSYYDLLIKHGLGVDGDLTNYPGNFRALIKAVTLHAAMGRYLDMLRNDKPNQLTGLIPNENYARELLQLFSIGLNRVHPDGSLMLSSRGTPIPTYDQDVVVGLAHVFTGWDWGYTGAYRTSFGAASNWLAPMREVPARHFTGQKRTLNNRVLPGLTTAGGVPLDPYATSTPSSAQLADPAFQALAVLENEAVHDQIFHHPNCGPFICRQLIQRLVTSSPSPGYIYRVVRKFEDNGSGVRGDLRAVVKAILLDYEARSLTAKNQQGFGKQREPVLRVANFARALRPVTSFTGGYRQDGGVITVDTSPYLHRLTGTVAVELSFSSTASPTPALTSQSGLYALTNTFPSTATQFNVRAKDIFRGTWTQTGNTITVAHTAHGFSVGSRAFIRWRTGATAGLANGQYPVVSVVDANSFTVTSPDSATVTSGATCDVAFVKGTYVLQTTSGVSTLSLTLNSNPGLAYGEKVFLTFTPNTGQTQVPVSGAPSGLYTLGAPLPSGSPLPDPRRFSATPDVGTLGTTTMSGTIMGAALNPVLDRGSLASGTDIATTGYSDWGMGDTDATLTQTPMRSPTVFNFFLPDYQFPGLLQNNGLITPEFELSSETNVTRQANFLYGGIYGTFYATGLTSFGGQDIAMDFGPWIGDRNGTVGGTNYWTNDLNLRDLIREMSKLLMASSMSQAMEDAVFNYVSNTGSGYITYPAVGASENQRRDRFRAILHFIAVSAEFTIQK